MTEEEDNRPGIRRRAKKPIQGKEEEEETEQNRV